MNIFDIDLNELIIEVYQEFDSQLTQVQTVNVENILSSIFVQVQEDYAPVQSVNGKIGWVVIDKNDVGLSNVENVSILGASGNIQNQINNLSGYTNANFYPHSNPSGFITGVDTSSLYPRSNPSGFITGVNLSAYVTTGQTGDFYPRSNPSGFVTGVDLSSYATSSNLANTGSTLDTKINILSGSSVLLYGNQTVSGVKTFASRPTVNGTGVLLSGEAASLPTTIVYTTGDQTISGIKTFTTVNESFSVLSITNQTINFPLNSGMNFILPLTTGITGITFSNTPTNTFSFTLRVDYSGAHSIVWPTGTPSKILWPSSTAPTLTSVSGKKDFFTFVTYNSGAEFFGFNSSQNF